ncbi:MAG: metalloregulator ArsR/SmtB family transcription factor [Pseudomonadota bacterium]
MSVVTVALDAEMEAVSDIDAAAGDEAVGLDEAVGWMRAAGETTRVRLLVLLDQLDLTVSDLMSILDQSQPRLSRHLKLLVEAGLAERSREGAWAYFRTVNRGPARSFLNAILQPLDGDDPVFAADGKALERVLRSRQQRASDYFANNAANWDRIRALHIAEEAVEEAMLTMALAANPKTLLDLGTGTGRILQLFAPHIERGVGLDTSHDMLSVARSALASDNTPHIQARLGDVYALNPVERYDLIVLHQVLHFLEEPGAAIARAAACLSTDGRLLIVDFEPHRHEFLREDHAHRRLGISDAQIELWFADCQLQVMETRSLKVEPTLSDPTKDGPVVDSDEALTVRLWLGSLV